MIYCTDTQNKCWHIKFNAINSEYYGVIHIASKWIQNELRIYGVLLTLTVNKRVRDR